MLNSRDEFSIVLPCPPKMDPKPEDEHIHRLRSAGFFTKGLVYILAGVLTFMAAFGLGGDVTGTTGVIRFLINLPLGPVLVGLISLGLAAYALWRLVQVWLRPKKDGGKKPRGWKGVFTRIRFLYSAIFYAVISYSFAKPLVKDIFAGEPDLSDAKDHEQEEMILNQILNINYGSLMIGILAFIVALQALMQIRLAYTAHFMKKIDSYPSLKHEYEMIRKFGRFGYAARAVVFGIIAYFLGQVVVYRNSEIYKGTEGALHFLLSFTYGPLLLGTTATGLIGYGIFNIMVARHAKLTKIQ
jgi:hypothetical protein